MYTGKEDVMQKCALQFYDMFKKLIVGKCSVMTVNQLSIGLYNSFFIVFILRGSDRNQTITRTNAGTLPVGPVQKNFGEI